MFHLVQLLYSLNVEETCQQLNLSDYACKKYYKLYCSENDCEKEESGKLINIEDVIRMVKEIKEDSTDCNDKKCKRDEPDKTVTKTVTEIRTSTKKEETATNKPTQMTSTQTKCSQMQQTVSMQSSTTNIPSCLTRDVTVTRIFTKTVTKEKPITLYREVVTTVTKTKPLINYKVTTVTETEVKTKYIGDSSLTGTKVPSISTTNTTVDNTTNNTVENSVENTTVFVTVTPTMNTVTMLPPVTTMQSTVEPSVTMPTTVGKDPSVTSLNECISKCINNKVPVDKCNKQCDDSKTFKITRKELNNFLRRKNVTTKTILNTIYKKRINHNVDDSADNVVTKTIYV